MQKIISTFRYYCDKRFSTIAGTLVYFWLMSIAPFILWLTLVFGNVDVEPLLDHKVFESVSPFLHDLKNSAESAASGAGIVFLATSLYSSTNFFYHLRRSGEIIYETRRVKGGLKLRISSLFMILAAIVMVTALTGLSVVGNRVLSDYLPFYVADIVTSVFLTALAFTVALVLNLIACPYRMKAQNAVTGSLLTTALWMIFVIGFTIYMQFASPERLYGKIAVVIIFLLWSYIMMICFVIGMIKNGTQLPRKVTLKTF